MSELVGFLDAEALAVTYLVAAFGERGMDVHVSSKLPTRREQRMVRVTRTGGVRRDPVSDLPQMVVECWDLDDEDAYGLANLARALLEALPLDNLYGKMVRHVDEMSGPVFNEDPDTDLPRYQFTVELSIRGQVIG